MTSAQERAALVALLKTGAKPWRTYAALVEERGSALTVLEEELGLLASDGLAEAIADIEGWERRGMRMLSVLDPDYPENLRAVYDRPPLVFVAGTLDPADSRSLAVVGTRAASPAGIARTRLIAKGLAQAGYTVVSGLASGVDTEAHNTALRCGGRTIAVIGTGLGRCYPPDNAGLQRLVASRCAVMSQFWPHSPPSRTTFPMRNATMSGLALGTVVVEASATSGARMQARLALEHGRPVFLTQPLLEQQWARELSDMPGTHVVRSASEIVAVVERLNCPGALVS